MKSGEWQDEQQAFVFFAMFSVWVPGNGVAPGGDFFIPCNARN